jgi:PIN domain-containing protein
MKTVAEGISERIEVQRALLREFLLEHSGGLRDLNTRDSSVFIMGPSRAWAPLSQEGRRLQSRLLEMNGRLSALIRALLRNAPDDGAKALKKAQKTLEELIDQSHLAWVKTTEQAFGEAEKALDKQLELLGNLYDPVEGPPIYVPDTNALLWNPGLEEWRFDEVKRFTLVLTAAVLGELDRLKIEHRNPEVRERAEGLIRRIKSYRGRGDLASGVPLVKNVSAIKTIALEPNVEETLPWLDPSNEDDRILASFVEVMREHVRTSVILVTRDINLQNKAGYAGLPFVEPPDPPASESE